MTKWENNSSVKVFRDYLRIPSVHPDVDYSACVDFLLKQADSLNLKAKVVNVAPGKPVVVMTWPGLQPELAAVMLNSHMDVVAVYEEFWTHPPFGAHLTEDGWIYARGTQDMKSIGIMHLESVRRLIDAGKRLNRTIHITFVPDEETGSVEGMRKFVETKEFQDLNVGVSLDESMPSTEESSIIVFYGERVTYQFKIKCKGEPNHSSMMPANTAGEKLRFMINKLMDLRAVEKKRLDRGDWLGNITSVNLTQIFGGVQPNVLPESLSAIFDIRMAPGVDHVKLENTIKQWCEEAGEGTSYEFIQKNPVIKSTDIANNLFWKAIQDATKSIGVEVNPLVCPGATDARFVRLKGISSFGFSPILDTEPRLHAHDERIHADVFLKGLDIMEKVVETIANVA